MAANRALMKICFVLFGVVATYVILTEVEITRECYLFCNSDNDQECYLRRTAVLIYDNDVAAHEMGFSQNTHPNINLASYAMEIASGRFMDINCPVDHYWPHVSTLSRRNSCAVVGNGGILSDSNCGPMIDAHDYVIRANLAPIEGYTADVGEKANLTVLNFETLLFLRTDLTQKDTEDSRHQMYYVDRLRYLNDSVLWYSKSTLQRNSGVYLREITHILLSRYRLPIRFAYSWRSISVEKLYGLTHYATTGFNAYVVAKTFCSHITLYGFYPFTEDDSGYHIKHHYYEDVPYDYNNAVHNIRSEFKKLKEFEEKGEVTIVTDICPGGVSRKKLHAFKKKTVINPVFAFPVDKKKLMNTLDLHEDSDDKENDKMVEDTIGEIGDDDSGQYRDDDVGAGEHLLESGKTNTGNVDERGQVPRSGQSDDNAVNGKLSRELDRQVYDRQLPVRFGGYADGNSGTKDHLQESEQVADSTVGNKEQFLELYQQARANGDKQYASN